MSKNVTLFDLNRNCHIFKVRINPIMIKGLDIVYFTKTSTKFKGVHRLLTNHYNTLDENHNYHINNKHTMVK